MIKLEEPHLLFEKTPVYKISERNKAAVSAPISAKTAKLLLAYNAKEQTVSPTVQTMFAKLAIASGFSDNQKLLINTASLNTDVKALAREYAPKLILVFGESALAGISGVKHTAETVEGAFVITTESPDVLVKNDAGKAALWKAIKAALKL